MKRIFKEPKPKSDTNFIPNTNTNSIPKVK